MSRIDLPEEEQMGMLAWLRALKPWWVHTLITAGAAILLVLHIALPSMAIDGTALVLFVLCALPWLGSILKSLKLPGGFEAEWREAASKIRETGLLRDVTPPEVTVQAKALLPGEQLSPRSIAHTDPNLALAALRLQLEQELRNMASKSDIPAVAPVKSVLSTLSTEGILTQKESAAIHDVMGVLNGAVHGAVVTPSSTEWALDVGEGILGALRKRHS